MHLTSETGPVHIDVMTALHRFVQETRLPVPRKEAFAWHERPGAFGRLVPPWENLEVRSPWAGIENGARVDLAVRMGPVRLRWLLEHRDFERGRVFCDAQLQGPFARYQHHHRFEDAGDETVLHDELEYKPPFGALGSLAAGFIGRKLAHTFAWRREVLQHDLRLHHRYRDQPLLRVAITGASGLVGSGLEALLTTGGHTVTRLVRRPPRGPGEQRWDPQQGLHSEAALADTDVVIHLAGESLASPRWSEAKKESIRRSRVEGTAALCRSLSRMSARPHTLIVASAIGYYGNRGDERLTEASTPGSGFLADVCQAWEAAADVAREAGIRVVHARLGVVLDPRGGALASMLPAFQWGAGARLGTGQQWQSWISRDDAISALLVCAQERDIAGPVNVCSPEPVTQATFTQTLGRVLGRPAWVRAPAWALRWGLGEMADEMLLASAHVEPEVLQSHGFEFRHPTLEEALRSILGQRRSDRAREEVAKTP